MRYLLLLPALAGTLALRAQTTVFSVGGSTAMTIKSGTIFSADSLVLTPGSDLTLSSNNVKVSGTAVSVSPAPSINRVYTLGSQINFTGTLQLYYQPSELNGNPESSLKYTDSAAGVAWLAASSSTVNTTSHFVQLAATGRNFIGATASHQGTVLALSLVSFTGAWQGNEAGLAWMIDQSGEVADFTVDRSVDGYHWTEIGSVAGIAGDGIRTYTYMDDQAPAGVVLYRLRINRSSGLTSYSSIVRLEQPSDDKVRLVAMNHSVIVYFEGFQPEAVRVVNAAGALVRYDKTSRWRYSFDGLLAGVYYLQYEINGRTTARSFLVN
jgi:hypothetical protein